MDHETRKPSKLTPGKSKQDGGHRESATSSCSKQLVRKAKLSLQKSHKRGRRNLISTLTAADLNDTDDFKSARTLTDGCKTNRQTAERQNNVKRGQTCVDTHKTDKKNDLRSGQTSVDTHKTDKKNDLRSGQTFSNRQRMPLGSDGDSRDVAKVVGESTSVSTVCPACEEILNKEEFTDHIKTCLQQFAHKHERDGCGKKIFNFFACWNFTVTDNGYKNISHSLNAFIPVSLSLLQEQLLLTFPVISI